MEAFHHTWSQSCVGKLLLPRSVASARAQNPAFPSAISTRGKGHR